MVLWYHCADDEYRIYFRVKQRGYSVLRRVLAVSGIVLMASAGVKAEELELDPLVPDEDILALPGQSEDTASVFLEKPQPPSYKKPDALMLPYLEMYYVKPTLAEGEKAEIPYYVTDWKHSRVRFGEDVGRFAVELSYSSDLKEWKSLRQTDVKTGDGRFDLGALPVGEYVVRMQCTDAEGRKSRVLWGECRVVTADFLNPGEGETARPSAEELAKYGVQSEADDFYAIVPVELAPGVEFPVGICAEFAFAKKAKAVDWRGVISNAVDAAIADEAGRKAVADRANGYVVVAPAKDGEFIYRSRDWRRIVPGAKYDAAKVEARSAANSDGLTRYLAEMAAAGKRRVVLPKGVWRISPLRAVFIPSRMTLDLGGGKIKVNGFDGTGALPIRMYRATDAHLVNGTVEGEYFEHGYERCKADPEHALCIGIISDSRFCSIENLEIRNTTASGTWFGDESVGRFVPGGVAPAGATPFGHGVWSRAYKLFEARKGERWESGVLQDDGTVRETIPGCYTSPMRNLGALATNRYFAVGKRGGYAGLQTRSAYLRVAFYGADGGCLGVETAFQFYRILIPAGAKTARITIEMKSAKRASETELYGYYIPVPRDCVWRNLKYVRCRTCALSVMGGFNMLFEDIDISRSGDESCRCASDAEDGWDDMQNMTFRRITCHDNPNGEFTVCCGHAFVYENCHMRFSMYPRVESALIRNCKVKGGSGFGCTSRQGTGYLRFENNDFARSWKIDIGSSKGLTERNGIPEWELVIDNATFRGESEARPAQIIAQKTGRYRNCTFENCKIVGPPERFTDCKLGKGCATDPSWSQKKKKAVPASDELELKLEI